MFNKIAKSGLALLMLGSASMGLTTLASAHSVEHHAAKAKTHKEMATMVYGHAVLKGLKGNKAHGTATLTLDTKTHTMTVVLKVWGLAKDSKHPAHIHLFKDGKVGAILYPFSVVVADAKGYATVTNVFHNVKAIDAGGWSVNVHENLKNYAVIANGVVEAGK